MAAVESSNAVTMGCEWMAAVQLARSLHSRDTRGPIDREGGDPPSGGRAADDVPASGGCCDYRAERRGGPRVHVSNAKRTGASWGRAYERAAVVGVNWLVLSGLSDHPRSRRTRASIRGIWHTSPGGVVFDHVAIGPVPPLHAESLAWRRFTPVPPGGAAEETSMRADHRFRHALRCDSRLPPFAPSVSRTSTTQPEALRAARGHSEPR